MIIGYLGAHESVKTKVKLDNLINTSEQSLLSDKYPKATMLSAAAQVPSKQSLAVEGLLFKQTGESQNFPRVRQSYVCKAFKEKKLPKRTCSTKQPIKQQFNYLCLFQKLLKRAQGKEIRKDIGLVPDHLKHSSVDRVFYSFILYALYSLPQRSFLKTFD